MSEYIEVIRAEDLKDGEMKQVKAAGHEILIAKAGGSFFAADNRCPHLGSKLATGTLNGTIVTCPRHASQFDLRDGRVVRWTDWAGITLKIGELVRHPRPLATYQVKVEGDRVLVQV